MWLHISLVPLFAGIAIFVLWGYLPYKYPTALSNDPMKTKRDGKRMMIASGMVVIGSLIAYIANLML